VAVLGLNPGNFMTYLFQLMSPFLLLGICGIGALRGPRRLLLLPLVWYSLFQAWSILPKDFRIDPVPWERTRELVAGSERILASPILVMTLIEQDKTVYQAGHTFYFRLAENKPAFLEPAQPERRVAAIWRAYLEQLYADVRERKFDLVLLTPWDVQGIFQANPPPGMDVKGVEYFKRYYHITETFPISLTERPGGGTFQMQVWRPRAEPEQATP
jgi:hypothetical protein